MIFGTLIEFPSEQSSTVSASRNAQGGQSMSQGVHTFSCQTLDGKLLSLADLEGKVILIVNTASRCVYTPQYEALQALHQELGSEGLVIIGFPCNQFGRQEFDGEVEIGAFCQKHYGVSFLMSERVNVNGANAHPLFKYLKAHAKGIFGTQCIKWNFTKFLVRKNGEVFKRYATATKPFAMKDDIKALLAE